MRVFIVRTVLGTVVVNEEKEIVKVVWPKSKDPKKIMEFLERNEKISLRGYEVVSEGDEYEKAERYVRENLTDIAISTGFVKTSEEFDAILREVITEITKKKIKESVKKDVVLIHVNRAIEELERVTNVMVERLKELYGLHFPELEKIEKSSERYVELVEKYGSRKNMEKKIGKEARESMGIDFGKDDLEAVVSIAREIRKLYKLRKDLLKYMKKILEEIAPNTMKVAGVSLAAKLISKAGNLEKLAKMPSSTIQLLGAEKALFRFLHGKGKSPRFGLLFSHDLVQKAPERLKGKVARAVASKIAMAVRLDFYSKEDKGEQLRKELEEKVKRIVRK